MPRRRKLAAFGALLTALLAFTVFRPPSTPGPLERDFEAYYAAGVTVNAGRDPYGRAIWRAERRVPGVDARREEVLPFVGPAAALPLWSLLARLPYRSAVAVWTLVLVGALLAIVAAGLTLARAPRDIWLCGLAGAFAAASAPALGSLALGQVALVSAGAVAMAVVAYRKRWTVGAFGATLVAALQPNLVLPLAASLRSRRDTAVAAASAAAFAGLTLVAGGGLPGFGVYLHHLGAHASAEAGIAIQYSPAALAAAFGVPPDAAAAVGIAIAVSALVAAVAVIVRARLGATSATLTAMALLPLSVPFFHEHDFALELLPLVVLAARTRGPSRALTAVAAVLLLVDWFGLAQRNGAQGQILCLGATVVLAFAGLNPSGARRARRADAAGAAAFVAVAALAVPLAIAHPAPTWPDALPPGYAAPAGGDASTVWRDEQHAAGLAARDPVWGLLRALPLGGCLVLVAAVVSDARRRRRARSLRGESRAPFGTPPLARSPARAVHRAPVHSHPS
jgi:hypothetical protein